MKRLIAVLSVVVLAAAAGATAYAWHEMSSIEFSPRDGESAEVLVLPTPRAVFAAVADRAGGGVRREGAGYGCAEVAAGRRYRCVVPGEGATGGELRYRVTVDRRSCWTARRPGARPTYGCLRTAARASVAAD